jgi:undecaprenyl diphosphate synthase
MSQNSPDITMHPLKHVAIIMDGNNRWAEQRGMNSLAGHKAGVEQIRDVLACAKTHGINRVSLFAFSSENWLRPKAEVRGLMSLFSSYLKQEAKALRDDGIKLTVVGSRERFSPRLRKLIAEAEALTQEGDLNLILCVDYGGRWDIVRAVRQLVSEVQSGDLNLSDINESSFDNAITKDAIPSPDLCIRTGGERRMSNFMLWQMAYTEFYFTDCFWPDFDSRALNRAVDEYYGRQRRFGSRSAQPSTEG